jgi:toxin ParE1/3/4
VPEPVAPPGIVLSPAARRDIRQVLERSRQEFGRDAAVRYEALLVQAFRDLVADPERPGSRERVELARGVRSYHLVFSRDRARTMLGAVHSPRHFVIYRRRPDQDVIDVIRVLHDARDLKRHLPSYRHG